jgi:tRNA-Thr(GGU) m(6)t(6)A37 methyltransferase TsaA
MALRLREVGRVESELLDPADAPLQGDEGAPGAWLLFEPAVAGCLDGIEPGAEIELLTWLNRADRGVRKVHPRGDPARRPLGVFATRSPDRPNPIGLHRVRVEAVDGLRLRVSGLEAIDGTPVLDLKPVLGPRR